jgi:protein-tyrosine-phosphatase/predicted ATP-grasp superfamily ATP-dependent carboligase
MPVLILDGHSRAALETLQSLGRAGLSVDLASESPDCLAMHSRYVRGKLRQPSSTKATDFHSWLNALDQERNYELIVPTTETSLLGLRSLDEISPLRTKAVLPSNLALDIALDKEKTWRLARDLSVPVPRSTLISTMEEIGQADQYPIVLKPLRSKMVIEGELQTLAVAVVKNEAERREQLQRWLQITPVLEQQYVSGRGMGAEFLFDHGRKVWHFVHERVHEFPLSGGASSYRRSIEPPARLLHDAEKLLTALQWHGVAMVEFKMEANGQHWLMEINPRLWGSLALSIDSGVDFPMGLVQVARGQQPPQQPRYKPHYTRDLRTDMEWMKDNLRADPQDPLLLTRSRSFSFIELLRPLTGRESWDHFDWHDLGITRRTLAFTLADQLRPVNRALENWRTKRSLLRHHRRVLASLREGPVRKILFLCAGNICRSPLAARLAEQQLPNVAIESAGFDDRSGRSSPGKMMRIADSFGLDLSGHRSSLVTREQLLRADLILAMDLDNVACLKDAFPEAMTHTTLLGLFARPASFTIADPYLSNGEEARRVSEQIRLAIKGLTGYLAHCKGASYAAEMPSAAPGVQS